MTKPLLKEQQGTVRPLMAIKLLHTGVWAVFVACILAIPIAAWMRRFDGAAWLSLFVWIECAVLAINRGRCPFTDMAARYSHDQAPNFDIYLPVWLARYNKLVFGTLFVAGELLVLWRWLN